MKPTLRKILKNSALILTILIIIFCIASWSISCYIENYFQQKLTAFFPEKTNGLYRIKFDKLCLELLKSKLHINNVSITTDSIVYKHLLSQNQQVYLINAEIKSIKLKFRNTLRIGKNEEPDIRLIEIDSPKLSVVSECKMKHSCSIFAGIEFITHPIFTYLEKDFSINVMNGEAIFEESEDCAIIPAKLYFNSINVDVLGRTYKPKFDNMYYSLNLNAKVFGNGLLEMAANGSKPMKDLSVKGTLGEMDMVAANELTISWGNTNILNGHLRKLDFEFHTNSQKSVLDMTMLYNSLKAEFIANMNGYAGAALNPAFTQPQPHNPNIRGDNPRQIHLEILHNQHDIDCLHLWDMLQQGIKKTVIGNTQASGG